MKNIGRNIRVFRELRGLSQYDLADAIGKQRSAIGNYERGEREPDLETIDRIAAALHISYLDLFADLDDDTTELDFRTLSENAPGEDELLSIYRALNASGQTVLLNTARGLSAVTDYQKAGASNDKTA